MGQGSLLLGIDIGTSACKAAVFRADGSECAAATEEYAVYYPSPGCAEQDPREWWQAVCRAVKRLLQSVDAEEIAGIGVDGQSWSCIPLGASGEVLYRTPIWMDMRCKELCLETEERLGKERLFRVSGNPFQPSYTTPKILWFRKEHPEVYEKTAVFLQSNSYIVYKLTGEITQDRSQCYGLHVYDMEKGQYDPELCRELGIDRSLLPEIRECHQVVGRVSGDAAALTGLLQGTPVVAGGLDAACGTLGAGVYRPGQTQEQGGQAGGMSICMERPVSDPRLILSNHVIPGLWLLQGGTVAGGASYQWLARSMGGFEKAIGKEIGKSQMYLMDAKAEKVRPGCDGLLFLPYLAGERSPIWDESACGMFFGLSFNKEKGHFYRAAMEGVAYALRHNLEVAKKAGAKVTSMNAVGGAAGSPVWMQIKADITGVPMRVAKADTATTLGAAILAGVGIGLYDGFAQAVEQTVRTDRLYEPNPENREIYERYFGLYLKLYEDNQMVMRSHAKIVKYFAGAKER